MARTRDTAAHALKRDAFLDVAQRIITTRGYGQLSIQEVLDETGASKGAFYHYFDSKAALLEAVVERMVEAAVGLLQPIADDPSIPAAAKFRAIFRNLAAFESERRDLMVALMDVWFSDENTAMRERFRRETSRALTPLFGRIISQGVAERCFDVADPDNTASVLVAVTMGVSDIALEQFIDHQAVKSGLAEITAAYNAYQEAATRILAAPPGSVQFGDPDVLAKWFD